MAMRTAALAISLLVVGPALPSFAQTDYGPAVTIFRGGTAPIAVGNLPELPAPEGPVVTVMAGARIVTVQQTAELPGTSLAIGAGAGMSAGTVALPTLEGGD